MPIKRPSELSPADLIALRQKRGWNQAQLAKVLNLTQGMVSKLERGEHPISGPLVPLLRKIMVESVP